MNFYCRSYCLLNMFRGTIMPIIRSSRVLYKWLLPLVFGAWFSSCRYGVELRVVYPVCGLLQQPANPLLEYLKTFSRAPQIRVMKGSHTHSCNALSFKGNQIDNLSKLGWLIVFLEQICAAFLYFLYMQFCSNCNMVVLIQSIFPQKRVMSSYTYRSVPLLDYICAVFS